MRLSSATTKYRSPIYRVDPGDAAKALLALIAAAPASPERCKVRRRSRLAGDLLGPDFLFFVEADFREGRQLDAGAQDARGRILVLGHLDGSLEA